MNFEATLRHFRLRWSPHGALRAAGKLPKVDFEATLRRFRHRYSPYGLARPPLQGSPKSMLKGLWAALRESSRSSILKQTSITLGTGVPIWGSQGRRRRVPKSRFGRNLCHFKHWSSRCGTAGEVVEEFPKVDFEATLQQFRSCMGLLFGCCVPRMGERMAGTKCPGRREPRIQSSNCNLQSAVY